MIGLDKDTLKAIARLMGDDVPADFEELAMLNYGPDSSWAKIELYDGPCLHDEYWGAQCESCAHDGGRGPFPSTFEMLVRDYLMATDRQPVNLDFVVHNARREREKIPF